MNLTEISYFIRKYGVLIILGFVFIILLIITLNLLTKLASQSQQPKTINNTEQIKINPVFGKISLPEIESKEINPETNFILDTIEGVPITASTSAEVLKFEESSPVLTYLEKSYLMAKTLGFDTQQIQPTRSNTLINFENNDKELAIEITDFSFKYRLKEEYLAKIANNLFITDENFLLTLSKEKLNEVNKYTKNLVNGKINLIYLKIDDQGKVEIVDSSASANSLRIDFYPNDINGIPIITESYDKSPNYIVIAIEKKVIQQTNTSEEQTDQQTNTELEQVNDAVPTPTPTPTPTPIIQEEPIIISASVQDKNFTTEIGVYPLISGDQAWENLQNKKAVFVLTPEEDLNQIEIDKMFLGYLYAPDKSKYLLPYYVFLGKDFIAYVPALDPEHIETN